MKLLIVRCEIQVSQKCATRMIEVKIYFRTDFKKLKDHYKFTLISKGHFDENLCNAEIVHQGVSCTHTNF